MYAIVRTGGKQYRVEAGRAVTVERLQAEEGSTVELGDVLMIAADGEVTVGTPLIEGARVMAEVETHGRAKKIIVFKYKAKKGYRKHRGHRSELTRLEVTEVKMLTRKPAAKKEEDRGQRTEDTEKAPAKKPAAKQTADSGQQTAKAKAPAKKQTAKAKAPAKKPAAAKKAPAKKPAAKKPAAKKPAPAKKETD